MTLGEQIRAGIAAPLAFLAMRPATWLWCLLYLGLAGGVLFGVAEAAAAYHGDVEALLLGYLFPESWQPAARLLVELYFESQARAVLLNAVVAGALVLVSLLLFPVKERLSASFEARNRLTDAPHRELPLWRQGLEELKLLLLYVTAQMLIFRLGYHPDPARKQLAVALGYGFVVFTFAVDFLAPVLQRHGLKYSAVIKALLARPVATGVFGAVFAAPSLLVTAYVARHPEMELLAAVRLLFGVQVGAVAWAAVGGTWLGARMLPGARQVRQSPAPVRGVAWVALLATFGWNAYAYGAAGLAVHHKSQVLKLDYDLDWRSVGFDAPTLGGLLVGEVDVGVRIDLRIGNPTTFDVALEDTRLEVRHEEALVATSHLDPLLVPAGATAAQTLRFRLNLRAGALLKGRELLEDRYALTLFVLAAPGVEVPIYLRRPKAT